MSNILRRFCTLAFLAVFSAALAQVPHAAEFPVGHWVAEHPSNGGIGSWWDFRPGGKVRMYVGAVVTAPVSHTADTITVPSATLNGPPEVLHYKVEGNTLKLKKTGEPESSLTRFGPAPVPSDPLLGRWRPDPPKTPSSDPKVAAYQKALAGGVYVFGQDNTQSVRIPFTSRPGTWNASTRTLEVEGAPHSYTFRHDGAKLVLVQQPDGQKTDTYLPDPLFH